MVGRLPLRQLNFKHLRYFWTVVKAGSIARAAQQLHLSPQAISGQLNEFEKTLGVALFRRVGRGLEPTEIGMRVLGYAEQIFSLGEELLSALAHSPHSSRTPFRVGIADSVPKIVAYRLVQPLLAPEASVHLVCREGRLTYLLGELALHQLDMVVADRPAPENVSVRSFDHFLGESAVSIFGAGSLARPAAPSFPQVLEEAPFLLPGAETALQARLLQWFDECRIRPRLVGEFDDSALMMAFGQAGVGFFAAPSAIEETVIRQYEVALIGRIESVREQLYAITTERQLSHPLIAAVCRIAQRDMFGLIEDTQEKSIYYAQ
ncbi:MAG: transcriptional activator NhaR [Rhodocyclaceae bacterium]|nr:transcriptional activator NhaR [Rhodocyclaceae bacterium]